MPAVTPAVVDMAMVSAYGWTADDCWQGLLTGRSAIDAHNRFSTAAMASPKAALLADITPDSEHSLVWQMLSPLLEKTIFPPESELFLATTLGEIEYLERAVLEGGGDPARSNPSVLLDKLQTHCGLKQPGVVISSACTSSSTAIARAADRICRGDTDSVLVVACDCVSEFISAGFSALMAMAPEEARPFDINRQGLSIGEAAGYVLLMSKERARQESRPLLGSIAGWGLSGDAHHMTGPAPDGSGLARAITAALRKTGLSPEMVGSIAAHGTGTIHNDAMEIQAFQQVFPVPVPTYSIKGGTGHTMGAAGLIETIIGLRSLQEQSVPPTVNLVTPEPEGAAWLTRQPTAVAADYTVTTNSGFGGTNCALVLGRGM